MRKNIILLVIVGILPFLGIAQEKSEKPDLTEKMAVFKGKDRQIKFKKDLFYDYSNAKEVDPATFSKDSLRHFLVDHGLCDYSFEYCQLKMRKSNVLDESFICKSYPKLAVMMKDTLYNKVTYFYNEVSDSIIIELIFSQSLIDLDDVKYLNAKLGVGYYKEEITFKGKSNIGDIKVVQNNSYDNILKNKLEKKENVPLYGDGQFEITFNVSKHESKYAGIVDVEGNIYSVIKVY